MKKPKAVSPVSDEQFEYGYLRGRLAQAREEARSKKALAKEASKRGAQARREQAQDAAQDWQKRADALRRVNPKLTKWSCAGRIVEQLREERAEPVPARRTVYAKLA